MNQSSFHLTWESHKNNLCSGLSKLQQHGEFVDMTLAADGHHVKVHQLVMSLASPYIKQLISSAHCTHPIIFLNNMSYRTLSALLEYIYTGSVLVGPDLLPELVRVARDLRIQGLDHLDLGKHLQDSKQTDPDTNMEEDIYFEVTTASPDRSLRPHNSPEYIGPDKRSIEENDAMGLSLEEGDCSDEMAIEDDAYEELKTNDIKAYRIEKNDQLNEKNDLESVSPLQYTVSNQGSLQLILNRFVYYLKHTNRDSSRNWRCVDYLNARKCPALVITRDDVVVQRISAHSHGFHDSRILKKVHANAVFSALKEAEEKGSEIKSRPKDKRDS